MDKELESLTIERNCIKFINDGILRDELPSKERATIISDIATNLAEILMLRSEIDESQVNLREFYDIHEQSQDQILNLGETGNPVQVVSQSMILDKTAQSASAQMTSATGSTIEGVPPRNFNAIYYPIPKRVPSEQSDDEESKID